MNREHAPFAIENVRLFDGAQVTPGANVAVREGAILSVHAGPVPPSQGASSIDGTGCTLMPGLIDSHVHAWGPLEKTLSRYLLFGVTTALEMQCDGDGLTELRQIRDGDPPHCAQLLSSGFPVTVPAGHGTEYGFAVPTVSRLEDVESFVDARIAEGSDYIKIMFNDPRRGRSSLALEMVRAAVEVAHARGRLSVVHVNSLRTANEALECGADALAHVFLDPADDGFSGRVGSASAFVIPTLTVLQSASGIPGGVSVIEDERLACYLTSLDRRQLTLDFGTFRERIGAPRPAPPPEWSYTHARSTVGRLADAGVSILAGTDAPNPGTTHGASMHRELELLVDAGMSPSQALAAATSVPARCFGLVDRGSICAGLRADLLLVRGDPTSDITATRDIVGVWKAGVRLERVSRAR